MIINFRVQKVVYRRDILSRRLSYFSTSARHELISCVNFREHYDTLHFSVINYFLFTWISWRDLEGPVVKIQLKYVKWECVLIK